MGWTSIYQLFWCSPGVQGFDTLPYSFFWGGVLQDLPTSKSGRMLGRILLEGGEDTQFHHHFRLWGNSPPNIHTCVELQDLSTPQKQSSPIKFRIQSFRFNYSATYIISHPISFSEGEFTNFSVWRCRFSLLFVDYITLLLCGSTHPWALRRPSRSQGCKPDLTTMTSCRCRWGVFFLK